jgi:hypothetical protein
MIYALTGASDDFLPVGGLPQFLLAIAAILAGNHSLRQSCIFMKSEARHARQIEKQTFESLGHHGPGALRSRGKHGRRNSNRALRIFPAPSTSAI